MLQVAKLAVEAGAMKAAPLAVSGAFHTPLMQPAREALVEVRMPAVTSVKRKDTRNTRTHTTLCTL